MKNLKVYLDTSVLIPALSINHPNHGACFELLVEISKSKKEGFISNHGIFELYSILTSLPLKPRTTPLYAEKLLEKNIYPYFKIVSITEKEIPELIKYISNEQFIGGIVYDYIHYFTALKSHTDILYTYNNKDFIQFKNNSKLKIKSP